MDKNAAAHDVEHHVGLVVHAGDGVRRVLQAVRSGNVFFKQGAGCVNVGQNIFFKSGAVAQLLYQGLNAAQFQARVKNLKPLFLSGRAQREFLPDKARGALALKNLVNLQFRAAPEQVGRFGRKVNLGLFCKVRDV